MSNRNRGPSARAITLAALFVLSFAGLVIAGGDEQSNSGRPFRITVVDSQSGRGVPLVELTTVNGITHVTDSAGVIAFDEPGMLNQDVFFGVRSHGYSYPKDGFD